MKRALLLSTLVFTGFIVSAQFTTQRGTKDAENFYQWDNPDNWVGSLQPDPLTSLIDDEIVVNGYITTSSGLTFDNLGNNNDEIIVNDTLVVDGDVFFDNNALTLVNNGLIIVFGNFRSDNKADIENNGTMVVTGNLTLNGGQQDYSDGNGSGGGIYVGGTIGGSSSDGVAGANGDQETDLSNFGPDIENFVNEGGSTPLPVKLVYFKASASASSTTLNWKTSSELNNDYFSIERSEDGRSFYEIGTVDGNGTTTEERLYSFTDHAPIAQVEYYRLKQIDFDGAFEYSKVQVGYASKLASDLGLSTYPNPVRENISVKSTRLVTYTKFEMINISGQVVADLRSTLRGEGLIQTAEIPPVERGFYYLRYQTIDGVSGYQKIIVE